MNRIYFVILALSVVLYGCFVDRSGTAPPPRTNWTALAQPGVVCPADDITLVWDLGSFSCPGGSGSCNTLTITDGQGVLPAPFTSTRGSGTHSIGTVERTVDFIFSVESGTPGTFWATKNSLVQVIGRPGPATRNWTSNFEAVCERGRYNLDKYLLDMTDPAYTRSFGGFGGCVKIKEICNELYEEFIVYSRDGSLPAHTLRRGECVTDLNLNTDLQLIVEFPPGPRLELGDICPSSVEGSPVPEISVRMDIHCNIERDECQP